MKIKKKHGIGTLEQDRPSTIGRIRTTGVISNRYESRGDKWNVCGSHPKKKLHPNEVRESFPVNSKGGLAAIFRAWY